MRTLFILSVIIISCVCSGFGQSRLMYYGVDDINIDEFPFLRDSLGGNFAMIELNPDSLTWKNTLKAAEENELKLIIWPAGSGHQWTPWAWDGSSWDISEGIDALTYAENYMVSGGESLIAVVMSHEPFYNNGDPFTTSEMQLLYSSLKAVAPHVQLFVYMNDMVYYDNRPGTSIENGIMDIAGIWLHCFGEAEGTVEESLAEIDKDFDLIQNKGLEMQLFFAIQTFAIEGTDYMMPTAAEMLDFGTRAIEKEKLDGIFWYPWNRVATSYTGYLSKDRYDSNGADRWDVVKQLSALLPVTDVKAAGHLAGFSSLMQNYPNPFLTRTTIPFLIREEGTHRMTVYNLYGRRVAELFEEEFSSGSHSVEFNASGLVPGVYYYTLENRTLSITKKMVIH